MATVARLHDDWRWPSLGGSVNGLQDTVQSWGDQAPEATTTGIE